MLSWTCAHTAVFHIYFLPLHIRVYEHHHYTNNVHCAILHNKNIMHCVTFNFKLQQAFLQACFVFFSFFSLSVIVSLDVNEGFDLLFQCLSLSLWLSGLVLIWSVCPLIGLSESSSSTLNKVSLIPSETTSQSHTSSHTSYQSLSPSSTTAA